MPPPMRNSAKRRQLMCTQACKKKKKSCFGFVLVKKRFWTSSFLLCHLGGLHVLFYSLSCHSATLYFTNRVLPLNIAPNIKKKKATPQQSVTQKKKSTLQCAQRQHKRQFKKKKARAFLQYNFGMSSLHQKKKNSSIHRDEHLVTRVIYIEKQPNKDEMKNKLK